MATLWASAEDARRLKRGRTAVYLVGSYDGSGNFGDVLQFASALETVRGMDGAPLPVAIVERETLGHHRTLVDRYPALLGAAAYVYFDPGLEAPWDDLVEVGDGAGPGRAALYVYGGGFLNWRWGARKIEHADAARRLAGRPLPVAFSGQQVDEEVVAPGGIAHELLARSAWIGVRDRLSLERMREHVPPAGGPAPELAGDDAVPLLRTGAVAVPETDAVVNLHLNHGEWAGEDPEEIAERIALLLSRLGEASKATLGLQPVIAYEDPRVSEREAIAGFLDSHGESLRAAGLTPLPPVDLLADFGDGSGASLRCARLTVGRSYHVTLASLMAGVPALLLAENDYYEQKAAGLRDLFDLDASLVGTRGDSAGAEAAVAALVDGSERGALVGLLAAGSQALEERSVAGRTKVAATLADCLRSQGPIGRLRRRLAAARRGVRPNR